MERKIRPDTAKIIGKSSRFWMICAILIIGILCSTVLGAWAHGKIQKTSGQLGKLNPQLEQIKTDYQMAQQNLEELENAVNSSQEYQQKMQEIQQQFYQLIPQIDQKAQENPNVKVAYLTFDDGPSSTYTPQFLEVLKEHHILATFFVVGNQVEQHPEIVQQIQQQGHTIANHSYSHDFNKVYSNPTAFINDIEQANNAIEQACGQRAKIIRFPGGSATAKGQFPAIKELLNQKGYTYVDWNASCGDGRSGYTGDQLYQNTVNSIHGNNRVTILMHDRSQATLDALPKIISYLEENQYLILPLTPDQQMIQQKK